MSELPRIISLDDHLIEPQHLWQSRLPAKYKDEGPRVVVAPRGEFSLEGAKYIEKPGTCLYPMFIRGLRWPARTGES